MLDTDLTVVDSEKKWKHWKENIKATKMLGEDI